MDWFSHIDLTALPHFLLQTPTPEAKIAPSNQAEMLEMMARQLKFLEADHARLAADFAERMKQLTAQTDSVDKDVDKYLSRVFALTTLATALGTGFVGFLGWSTWKEVKASIEAIVARQVSQAVAKTVDREIQLVRRSITREQVITKTLVDYFLENGTEPSREIELIRTRGFGQVRFCHEFGTLRRDTGDLVVVDLEHWQPEAGTRLVDLPKDRKEDLTKGLVDRLLVPGTLPSDTILVVYVNDRIDCLNNFSKSRVIMVGSEVSLIGNLADAAYVISASARLP
jgi:hypothetical protein